MSGYLCCLFLLLIRVQGQAPCERVQVSTDDAYAITWGQKFVQDRFEFDVEANGAFGVYLAPEDTEIINGNAQGDSCYYVVLFSGVGSGVYGDSEISYVCSNWHSRLKIDTFVDSDFTAMTTKKLYVSFSDGSLFAGFFNQDGNPIEILRASNIDEDKYRQKIGISSEIGFEAMWSFCPYSECTNPQFPDLCNIDNGGECVEAEFSYTCNCQNPEWFGLHCEKQTAQTDAPTDGPTDAPTDAPTDPPTFSPTAFAVDQCVGRGPQDVPITWDFESGEIDGWAATGSSFSGDQPVKGADSSRWYNQDEQPNFKGSYWVSSFTTRSNYEHIGCFVDDSDKDLQEGPMKQGYNQHSCYQECKAEYAFFALQDGGLCTCGNNFNSESKYYKVSNTYCSTDGLGTNLRNDIYVIMPEEVIKRVTSTGCTTISAEECCNYIDGRIAWENQQCVRVENVRSAGDRNIPCQPIRYALGADGSQFEGDIIERCEGYTLDTGNFNCLHDAKEAGLCVMENGQLSTSWVKLNSLNGNNPSMEQECLSECMRYPGATGCQTVWDQNNRGCYVFTGHVDRGDGRDRHHCWILDECLRRSFTYVGCYIDDDGGDLQNGPQNSGYTSVTCAKACSAYPYFALKDGGICLCGNNFNSESKYAKVSNNECGSDLMGREQRNAVFRNSVSGRNAVGKLQSEEFCINTGTIGFLVGGGCQDGLSVTLQTPEGNLNIHPKCRENMDYMEFNVVDFVGKSASIAIVDEARGEMGHITVDDFQFFWRGMDQLRFLGQEVPCVTPRYTATTWDFETGKLSGWTVLGARGAFLNQPMYGDVTRERSNWRSNHQGKYWIGTYENVDSDAPQGSLISEEFCITEGFISLFVGGGDWPSGSNPNAAYVALVSATDGTILRSASGRNSEIMTYRKWDVQDLIGQHVYIKVVDSATGTWGHINVDSIKFYWPGFDLNYYCAPCMTARTAVIDHLKPRDGEWSSIFECEGDRMSNDRMLQSGSWKTDDVKFVRMCVDENRNGINEDSECVTSTCASVLQGLKKAVPSLNIETEACDLDCIKQCWKGTDDLLERLTWRCWPRPEDGYLFHACGNHDGWHLNMRDRSHCSPHYQVNYGPVEVQIQADWSTIFRCEDRSGNNRKRNSRRWTNDVSSVRMCVDENRNNMFEESECVTSTCASVLDGLTSDPPNLQQADACDLECVKQCWKGPDDLLERLTWRCRPRPEDGYLFHACGNHNGWHLNMRDRSHCSPHFRHNYGPVEVQVQGRENRKIIDDVKSGRCFDLRRDETSDLSTSCGICGTEPLVTSMVSGNNGVKFYMDATSYYTVRLSGGGKFVTYTIPGDGGDCVDPGFSQSFNVMVRYGRVIIHETGPGAMKKQMILLYNAGDVFTIQVQKARVVYVVNDKVVHASSVSVKLPLNYHVQQRGIVSPIYLCPTSYTPATRMCVGPQETSTSWDFEDGNLHGWYDDHSGTAFVYQPTYGDNPRARAPNWIHGTSRHQGQYWIGTYEGVKDDLEFAGSVVADGPWGRIVSEEFCLQQNRISFLVGGGNHPDHTYVALVINGKRVKSATGRNMENMRYVIWNVDDHIGEIASIEIVDKASGTWGHINADDFKFYGQCSTVETVTTGSPRNVICSRLYAKADCLSHANPNVGNCVLCVDENDNPTECLQRDGNPGNAVCLSIGYLEDENNPESEGFHPHNKYIMASCQESEGYVGPIDVSRRAITIIDDAIEQVQFTLSPIDGVWPTSKVTCCLDYSQMTKGDEIPIGADTCCWDMDFQNSDHTVHFQTKKNFFGKAFKGTVKAVCKSEDELYCNSEKIITVTGKAKPKPPMSGSTCMGTGDPHYTDFSRRSFDWQAKGNLWFVRTLDNQWTIQTKTKCCTPWSGSNCRVTCADAVVMSFRSAKISLVLPYPNGAMKISRSGPKKLITLQKYGPTWKLNTPIGARCEVNHAVVRKTGFLNVWGHSVSAIAASLHPVSLCGDGRPRTPSLGRTGKTPRFTVADDDNLFEVDSIWVEGGGKGIGHSGPIISMEDCDVIMKTHVCVPKCCKCDTDPDCKITHPDLECCDPVCPEDDICCLHPERCCIGDDCGPAPPPPPTVCYRPPDAPCFDLRGSPSERRLLFDNSSTPCCYREMPTYEKKLSKISQNPPPEGYDGCCPEPDDCTKECEKLFNVSSLTRIRYAPGCKCVKLNETITFLEESCVIDSEALGCELIGDNSVEVTKIIENTLEFCKEQHGPGCDYDCPMECDLMSPNVKYHRDVEGNNCWCECEPPYFGDRCLYEDVPQCTGLISVIPVDGELDVIALSGNYLYEDDMFFCVFSAVYDDIMMGTTFESPAVPDADSLVCDGPIPDIGERICRYTIIKCEVPPADWEGYINVIKPWFGPSLSVTIKSDKLPVPAVPQTCDYQPDWTCLDLLSRKGYPDTNPCDEVISHWIVNQENLNEVVSVVESGYHYCCSDTPAPTAAPTPAPTNSPTWPAHIFVPVIDRHTPWYVDFIPPPTASTVDYEVAPSPPAYVYIPAQQGSMVMPYCLGFGDECAPIYGEY